MIKFSPAGELAEVLVLGAHCDDIEIGCGGTLAMIARKNPAVRFRMVVFSGDATRIAETTAAIRRLLQGAQHELVVHAFRDGFYPMEWGGIKAAFEELKVGGRPDLVLTHHEHDRHQDHRVICELTWNTFRDHLILEYEIPKYDGDLGRPGVYVPLTEDDVSMKLGVLLECFPSQTSRRWFTSDLFRSVMRLRGMECNSESGLAEAFHARKMMVSW